MEDLREYEIEIILSQHPYLDPKIFDEKFVFYYDETNNFRKVLLKEEGKFNIDNINSTFVLGGLVLEEELEPLSVEEARTLFNLQPTIREIKLKHFGQGNFIDILKSKKLSKFFEWILEKNIYIHLSATNLLYYGIVDIIDSVIDFTKWKRRLKLYYEIFHSLNFEIPKILFEDYFMQSLFLLKNELYEAVTSNIEKVTNLFIKYNYPNIDKSKISEFYKNLFKIININEKEHPHLYTFYELFSNPNEAPFITDNKDKVLIDSFLSFYIRNVILFKNSKHIFDEEKSIINELKDFNPIKKLNYEFQNSKNNTFIQFSDVIVGFAGKFYDYILNTDIPTIKNLNLNDTQESNLAKWIEIVDRSKNKCPAFTQVILPLKSFSEKKEILFSKAF